MTTTTTTTATAMKPDRAEINKRNAAKSTGPRSLRGKSRSKLNAVKHGMTAKTLVLPGEDPQALQLRLETWTADFQPQNQVEQYLIEQAVHSSWKLDRADRVEAARLAQNIESVPVAEANRQREEIAALGHWLLSDRNVMGDCLLRSELLNVLAPDQKRTYPDCRTVAMLNQPESIVRRLETTAAGCQWLLDRWAELRAHLEKGDPWGWDEKVKALRLLGKRPLNLEPSEWKHFLEYRKEGNDPKTGRMADLQLDAQLDERLTAQRPATLAILRGIAEAAIARLEPLVAEHRRRGESDEARQAAILSFDDSNEAERLRRYQFACGRSLVRSIDTFLKVRRSGVAADDGGETLTSAQDEVTETQTDSCSVSPPLDRQDSQNEPTDPPVDCHSPQDDPAKKGDEPIPETSGPAEAGTPSSDVSPVGDPRSGGIPGGSTDPGTMDPPSVRDNPQDDLGMPQASESASLQLPSLRIVIVALTLALAALAVASAKGHDEWQGKPTPPRDQHANRQNEPTATPRRQSVVPVTAPMVTPCTRPDRGLPVSPDDAPMSTIAAPWAASAILTDPPVSEPRLYRYQGRDSRARSTRRRWTLDDVSQRSSLSTACCRICPDSLSTPFLLPRPRTPGGTIT